MRLRFWLLIFAITFATSASSRLVALLPERAQPEATLRFASLRDHVTVRRDERGIPYISAANEEDLYFAQGYVTAGDRLWQMDLLRRTARGELAEIFGKPAIEEDKRRRVYGFAELAERLVGRASPPARAALESYARGVNAFIESRPANSRSPNAPSKSPSGSHS
jgi:penicillin amidase